jgi:hypothetical protein
MAAGTVTDFKVYDEQYFGGQYERLVQNIVAFNGASNGALLLVTELVEGNFERESFMAMISGLISSRDNTSIAAVTDAKTTQGELVGVKVNKRIGPVADTLDKWKKISADPALFSFYVGEMVADQKLQNMVNTAIMVVEAAIGNISAGAFSTDKSADTTPTMTHTHLNDAQRPMGDQAGRLAMYVMHSKPYFDLIGQALGDKIFNVADVVIRNGTVATLGKPTLVIDAPSLFVTGTPNKYATLALVPGAVEVKESEPDSLIFQPVTGLANLVYRLQGEYAYNVSVKGMKYDTTQGANPNDTVLGTAATWILAATDGKNGPGTKLLTT